MLCDTESRRSHTTNPGRRLLFALLVGLLALAFVAGMAAQEPAKNRSGKLLVASDIHFNPMADPALVGDLARADPAQWEGILRRSKLTAFSPYGQDSNWWLVQSSLDAMLRTEPHPTLVMFTGDLLAHNFPSTYHNTTHDNDPEHYRAFVRKTVEFVALQLRQRFPGVKILLTPGNNDEDCGDYSIEADGAFLNDTAETARALAIEDIRFINGWKALGSYSIAHPSLRGVRIVSLNTVFWSNKYQGASFSNGCATVNSTAAGDLLAWLESQLADAELAHEKVWLMFHIPPGIDGWASTHPYGSASVAANTPAASCVSSIVPMWGPQWTARFDSLLDRYHNTVLVSFAGHTHVDNFMVIGAESTNRQFVLINPAISPIYGQNPGFRIVDVKADGMLANQTTYYLTNLKRAGGNVRGRWKPEYTFARKWKVRRIDAGSLASVYQQIAGERRARELWLTLYMVSSSASPIAEKDVKGLFCAIEGLTPQSYAACACPTAPATPH